jgi:uncharacterized ParB-like nuclease family protein
MNFFQPFSHKVNTLGSSRSPQAGAAPRPIASPSTFFPQNRTLCLFNLLINITKIAQEPLTLDEIRRDSGIQPRVAMNLQHVKLLEKQLEEGQQLDPVSVFYDGELYWLADGFHRWHAHRNCCQEVIACNIHRGSRRDAVLYSVGANADHKSVLPRTRVDKHLAILRLLEDQEWKNWSDREIGHRCKVDHKSVGKMRQNLTGEFPSEKQMRTYRTKHGTVALMNTTNIGKKNCEPAGCEQSESQSLRRNHLFFLIFLTHQNCTRAYILS